MKLNHDCVRDMMLFMEENLTYGTKIDVSEIKLKSYLQEDLLYTADKLLEANYIDGQKSIFATGEIEIFVVSITWYGHQFLDNIRDDGVWNDTKNIISKFSSMSLSLVSDIASQVISSLVQKHLGLQ